MGCVCLQTSHAFLEIAAVHAALPTLLAHPSFSKHSVAKVKDEMVLPMHAGYTGLQKQSRQRDKPTRVLAGTSARHAHFTPCCLPQDCT